MDMVRRNSRDKHSQSNQTHTQPTSDQLGSEYSAVFYETQGGRKPVLKWIRSLDKEDQEIVYAEIVNLASKWPNTGMRSQKMPGCKGLWELNKGKALSGARWFRLFFFPHNRELVLVHHLHGKKSNKTPRNVKNAAIKRMEEHKKRNLE